MKRLVAFVAVFVAALTAGIRAENFEEVIDRLPPEKEDDIYSKINNVLGKTSDVSGNILDMLLSVSDLDVEKFVNAIDNIKGTFMKAQVEQRKKLEKERDDALAEFNRVIDDDAVSDTAKISASFRLADAYFAINEISKVEYPIKRALQLKNLDKVAPEKRVRLYAYLADSYESSGKIDREKRLLNNMQREFSSDPTSYSYGRYLRSRAMFNYNQAYYTAAIKQLREAGEILKNHTDIPGTREMLIKDDLEIEFMKILAKECTVEEGMMNFGEKFGKVSRVIDDKSFMEIGYKTTAFYMASGDLETAFSLAESMLDLIQTLNPDGSEMELDMLCLIGSMITANNALPEEARVDNKFTRKGDHHYLYGCKVVAEKLWDTKNNGKTNLIHNLNRQLASVYACKSAEGFIEAEKYRPSNIALAMLAKPGTPEQEQYSLFAKIHNRAEFHAKRARQIYEEELKDLREELHEHFLALNDNERTAYSSLMESLCEDILSYSDTHRKDSHIRKMVYDVCLLNKAILLDLSRSLSSIIKEINDPVLLQKNAELTAMREAITKAASEEEDMAAIFEMEMRADALEDEIILAIRDLRTYDPAGFIYTTWKDVKNTLPKNSVAVEFYHVNVLRNDGHYYEADRMVALSDDKDPEIFPIDMLQSNLDKAQELPYDQMLRWSFYYKVWEPFIKKKFISPKKRTTIYFSPFGRYHFIPLEYLPCEGSKNMADVYNMVRVSTTRTLPENHHASLESAVLYGDMIFGMGAEERGTNMAFSRGGEEESFGALPHTKDEVEAIHKILSPLGESTVRTGVDCMEENFKDLSGNARKVIHIATHGYYGDQNGLGNFDLKKSMRESGLAFNGAAVKENDLGDINDGRLTAAEISLLDLSDTDMVVMSACSTAKGSVTKEGVFGLQRGFKLAGVNTLVMSLWRVDDKATMDLMTTFYKGLAGGATKREALLKAQEYVKTQNYVITENEGKPDQKTINVPGTNPRLWSGFVILD
ncbi:MAG: CHAT domain-containing protein [Staphylococcus sp.]|nr:CHAT domain-containing protein [Staphylococcus sp.]